MQEAGVLSFVLVLVFLSMQISLLSLQNQLFGEIGETKILLMQVEKASYIRNEIEQNTDFLIGNIMENEMKKGNYDPEAINQKICSALFDYFKVVQATYASNPKVEFYSAVANSAEYKQLHLKPKSRLQQFDLCPNSKVLVVKNAESYDAEFSYTGSIFKDRIVFAEIAYKNYSQVFAMPFDYSVRKSV